jgi:thioester reductase-like protein
MEQYGVWKRGYEASILPLIGEMSLPKLGLGDDTWVSLATEVHWFR